MNSSDRDQASGAEDQAALWAARSEGSDLSESDKAALDAWLAADSTHPVLLDEYRQVSFVLKRQLPPLVAAGLVAGPPPSAKVAVRSRWNWAGAGLAAAAAVLFAFWLARPVQKPETIDTPAGQRRTIILADGSRVELNARTRLQVDGRSGTERRVRLADGEAFFVVARDRSRPFVVETPAGAVQVTGTKFDVRSEAPSELDVIVVEGSVQVRPGAGPASAPVLLGAGDRFVAGAPMTPVQKLTSGALEDALAWRQGQMVCDGVPLQEALNRFAHYHGREIAIAPDAADIEIGGRWNLDDLDGFLADLEMGWPVRVTRDPSGAIRVNRHSAP